MNRGLLFASFALVGWAGIDLARAESADVGGFQLQAPTGFVRGADEQHQENVTNLDSRSSMGVNLIAVRVFQRKTDESRREGLTLIVAPSPDIDPDAPSALEASKRAIAAIPDAKLESIAVRTIGGGLRGSDLRMTVTTDLGSARSYMAQIPRRGRMGQITYAAVGMPPATSDAVWEEILRGVRSNLDGPDPSASEDSGGNPATRAGAIFAYIAMGAGLLWWYSRVQARRKAARREAAARLREQAAMRRERADGTDRPPQTGAPTTRRPR